MITLYFEINNIDSILELYDRIEIIRYVGSYTSLSTPVGEIATLSDWEEVVGDGLPIVLLPNEKSYYAYDTEGTSSDWYSSRYVLSSDGSVSSAWSAPVLGDSTALYVNPLYPSELTLTSSENRIIDRIRLLIGDHCDLRRDFGEEALSNFYSNGKVFKLSEKGWPISINMGNVQYTSLNNPTVNGYRYLKFNQDVSEPTTVSGVVYGVDVWYYTFRYSDKEILDAYDNTPTPEGLTTTTANTESYILSTAIDLIRSELFLDAVEDGAIIEDDRSVRNPNGGLETRRKLLDGLEKKLDKLVKSLMMSGITGVLID